MDVKGLARGGAELPGKCEVAEGTDGLPGIYEVDVTEDTDGLPGTFEVAERMFVLGQGLAGAGDEGEELEDDETKNLSVSSSISLSNEM